MSLIVYHQSVSEPDIKTINHISNLVSIEPEMLPNTEIGVQYDLDNVYKMNTSFALDDRERRENYEFFDYLDSNYSFCSSVLDLYADDTFPIDFLKGKPFWIESKDEQLVVLGEALLYDTLDLMDYEKSWAAVRELAKYGDAFEEIIVSPIVGVIELKPLPPKTIQLKLDPEIEEGYKYAQELTMTSTCQPVEFKDWQISHYKIPARNRSAIFGKSMLADAIRALKMLEAAEVSMVIQRLMRSMDRYLYQINVEGMSKETAQEYIRQKATDLKRRKIIDVDSGRFDAALNAMASSADIFTGKREAGAAIDVDIMPAGNMQAHIDDVEYLKGRAVEALKAPQEYLTYITGTAGSTTKTLSNTDIRWARRIMRLQKIYATHLHKVLDVHFQVVLKRQIEDFDVVFASPSTLDEQAKLEALEIKTNIAASLQDYYPMKVIMMDIFKLSDEDAERYLTFLDEQKIDAAVVDAIASAEAEKMTTYLQNSAQGEEGEVPGTEEPTEEEVKLMSKDRILEVFKDSINRNNSLALASKNFQEYTTLKKKLEEKISKQKMKG